MPAVAAAAGFGAVLKSPWLWAMLAPSILERFPGLPEAFLPAGQKGQLRLSRAQMAMQERMFLDTQEATTMAAKASRERSDEMMERMFGLQKETQRETREMQGMTLRSQERMQSKAAMASMISAVLMAKMTPPPEQSVLPLSMVGMLRR